MAPEHPAAPDHPATLDDPAVARALTREDFPVLCTATSRWSDNDMFGHLNNAVYYQLFDTAINGWLIENTGIDPVAMPVMGVVAESQCTFLRELGFPQPLTVGLRVLRLGRSSVTYQLGLFGGAADARPDTAAAVGRWVHVYVDKASRVSVPIPDPLRSLMDKARPE